MSRGKCIEKYSRETKNGPLFCTIDLLLPQQPRNIFIGVLYHPRSGFCHFRSSSESSTFFKVLHIVIESISQLNSPGFKSAFR